MTFLLVEFRESFNLKLKKRGLKSFTPTHTHAQGGAACADSQELKRGQRG